MKVFRGRISGQVIYFIDPDVKVHGPSGALLVVDNYEIVAVTRQDTLAAV